MTRCDLGRRQVELEVAEALVQDANTAEADALIRMGEDFASDGEASFSEVLQPHPQDSRNSVRSKSESPSATCRRPARMNTASKVSSCSNRALAWEIDLVLKLRHSELKESLQQTMTEHTAAVQRLIGERSLPRSWIQPSAQCPHLETENWQQHQPETTEQSPSQQPEFPGSVDTTVEIMSVNGDARKTNGHSREAWTPLDTQEGLAELLNSDAVEPPKALDSPTMTILQSQDTAGEESQGLGHGIKTHPALAVRSKTSGSMKTFTFERQEVPVLVIMDYLMSCLPGLDTGDMKKLRSTRLWKLTHSNVFGILSAFMICAYIVFIGVNSDSELKAEIKGQKLGVEWSVFEGIFAGWFALELVLRIAAERVLFFYTDEWKLNLLDIILVAISLVGFSMDPSGSGSASRANAARVFRLFRFIRVLRIVRVIRSFQSLRLLAFSIIESMASLMWCFVVVLVVIYLFAIFILSGVTEHMRDVPSTADTQKLEEFWGGGYRAMVSLFMSISGGADWQDLLSPLREIDWFYEPIFMFYIFFMLLGVLNVVVATFVENTAQVARNDKDATVKAELQRVKEYSSSIKKFFHEADYDKSGQLSWDEFESYLQNDSVKAYFQTLELDVSEAHVLFKLLAGEDDEVSSEEFIDGCMRLKGRARSVDVNLLIYQTERMIDKMMQSQEAITAISQHLHIPTSALGFQSTVKLDHPVTCK
eukprot:TRINITY_DN59251_c0_g1_i1.p1 TRINITY_DN59251_c0_g1~~TRINITY_DN59251_c0_g1_i1.p1  ORF type:complete len:706 (-),score=128.07 TRINITY_DN59251_c0_g1_i1:44-2161(-)